MKCFKIPELNKNQIILSKSNYFYQNANLWQKFSFKKSFIDIKKDNKVLSAKTVKYLIAIKLLID